MLLDILLDIMEELSVTISHGIKLLHLLDILTIWKASEMLTIY